MKGCAPRNLLCFNRERNTLHRRVVTALRRAPPILANDMFRDHFRAHSDERQLQVFLGQRTGNPGVDLSMDVAVRKFLEAADFRMRDLMGHIF